MVAGSMASGGGRHQARGAKPPGRWSLILACLLSPLAGRALDPGAPIQIETRHLSIRLASPDQGMGVLDVRVTIDPKGAGGLAEWRMDVCNRGKGTGIYRPVFPVLECGLIGESGEDDYLIATATRWA
jgi:hypothetical protein